MTKKTRNSSKPAKPKSYVLLGTDEFAKPRGARFSDADPELLAKAAEAMHLWLIEVTNDELAELAAGLPAGRLHASGHGLVPYIKGELYSELLGAALPEDSWPPPDPGPAGKTCRAAGTRSHQAISSSRGRRSNAAGWRRW